MAYWRNVIPSTRCAAFGFALGLAGCVAAVPGFGLPIFGRVVEDATGAPVENAAVVFQVESSSPIPFGGTFCQHVGVAWSGADGSFSMPGWAGGTLNLRDEGYFAYKAGYIFETITADRGLKVNLKRSKASREERLEELDALLRFLSCIGDPKLEVVRVLQSIRDELEGLVRTAEEREKYIGLAKRRIELEQTRVAAAQKSK